MAWERRKGRGRYYSRTKRCGRKFSRIYVGRGDIAEAIAAADALARQEQTAALCKWRVFQDIWDSAAQAALRFGAVTGLFLRLTLVAAGYYQHDRGLWRKRHGRPNN